MVTSHMTVTAYNILFFRISGLKTTYSGVFEGEDFKFDKIFDLWRHCVTMVTSRRRTQSIYGNTCQSQSIAREESDNG